MGQDEETLVGDSLDHGIGYGRRFESALGQEIDPELSPLGCKHVGLDSLGTEARDAYSLVAVHDREPLEKGEGCCLGHTVRRGKEMVQQPGGRNGAEDVTLSPRQHAWQDVAGDKDVCHHVDFPDALPVAVGRFGTAAHRDAGVGAEDVDATVR